MYSTYWQYCGPNPHFKTEKYCITQVLSFSSQPHLAIKLKLCIGLFSDNLANMAANMDSSSRLTFSSLLMIPMRRPLCIENGGWCDYRGRPHLNHMQWIYEKLGFYN